MEQTLRDMVREELQRYQKQYGPDEGMMQYLHNWRLNLPPAGGIPSNSHRILFKATGLLDETFYDIAKKTSPPEELRAARSRIGPVKIAQTPRKFYETIDRALSEERIPVPEILRLQQIISWKEQYKSESFGRGQPESPLLELSRFTWPAFEWLWEFGYTHEDLTF